MSDILNIYECSNGGLMITCKYNHLPTNSLIEIISEEQHLLCYVDDLEVYKNGTMCLDCTTREKIKSPLNEYKTLLYFGQIKINENE